jgi:hypothetical protein
MRFTRSARTIAEAGRLAGGLVVAWTAFLCGCKAGYLPPKVPYDSAASLYDRARVLYQVDAGKLQVPVSVARIEGQHVSYQQIPSSATSKSTLGRLEIAYPHPRGLKGYALARVTIQSRYPEAAPLPSSTDEVLAARIAETVAQVPLVGSAVAPTAEVEETWEMDVPRAELDRVVAELNQRGFYERKSAATGPVGIETSIDGHNVKKSWDRVPELDALMVAVRSRGRLIAYHRNARADRLAGPTPDSVLAYRAYAGQDARGGGLVNAYVAGGPAFPGVSADPQSMPGPTPGSGAYIAQAPVVQNRTARLPSVSPWGAR